MPFASRAVSYTHLDVYKRQAYQWIARLGLQNTIARVSKKARNDVVGKFLSFDSVDWSRTIAYSMGHVSYTHLDVYKRQGPACSIRRRRSCTIWACPCRSIWTAAS